METYKSEEVIELLDARIHPTDNTVPECKCYIRLTANHVFISEDNFDGTYDDHYILDIAQIDEIRISEPYKTSIEYTSSSLEKNPGKKFYEWSGGRIGGMLSGGKKRHGALNPDKEAASKKFLEIIYRKNYEKTEHLYFDEYSSSPSSLINAFNKLKSGDKGGMI